MFQQFYDSEKKDFVRTASFRGMIQSSGNGSLRLMTDGIMGKDGASQIAALHLKLAKRLRYLPNEAFRQANSVYYCKTK